MKNIFLLILVLACSFYSKGQESEPIITDRPKQSISAFLIAKGKINLELGSIFEKQDQTTNTPTYLNALFRYGLTNGIELRLNQGYLGRTGEFSNNGLGPLTLGTKVHIMKEKGLRPQISATGQATLKTGNQDFRPSSTITELRLNFQNTISENWTIGYNLGFNDLSKDDFFYSIFLSYSIAKGWTAFAEPYGTIGSNSIQEFNIGLVYLLKPNLQFDLSLGSGVSNFLSFGASFGF